MYRKIPFYALWKPVCLFFVSYLDFKYMIDRADSLFIKSLLFLIGQKTIFFIETKVKLEKKVLFVIAITFSTFSAFIISDPSWMVKRKHINGLEKKMHKSWKTVKVR